VSGYIADSAYDLDSVEQDIVKIQWFLRSFYHTYKHIACCIEFCEHTRWYIVLMSLARIGIIRKLLLVMHSCNILVP